MAHTSEVAAHGPIGQSPQAANLQIHQKEREVVGNINRADAFGELNAVEGCRLFLPKHDIAQMQVSVTAAYETGLPSSVK